MNPRTRRMAFPGYTRAPASACRVAGRGTYVLAAHTPAVHHERLITGVAAAFAAIAVVFAVVAVVGSPVAFPVALAFAAAAFLMYDQLSGRMAARVYRRVERRARANTGRARDRRGPRRGRDGATDREGRTARRVRPGGGSADAAGGFGAGPREEWTPPRGGRTARNAATGRRRATTQRSRTGPSPADRAAYETLGLEPGADEDTVRNAYRDLVKRAHPDAPDGSRERFKAVKEAYEQLTE